MPMSPLRSQVTMLKKALIWQSTISMWNGIFWEFQLRGMSKSMPAAQNHIQVSWNAQKESVWQILYIFRHIFLSEDTSEAFILYSELNYTLCGYLLPIYSCVLSPCPVRGKDCPGNCHPCVTDSVFHLSYWSDPRHLPNSASAGPLPLVFHGAGGS